MSHGSSIGAVVGGLIGGAVGAGLWAIVSYLTGYEIGWIALGIGFVVGAGVRAGAGSTGGALTGAVAVVIAFVSIFAGKYAAIQIEYGDLLTAGLTDEQVIAIVARDMAHEREGAGEVLDWPANVSDAAPDAAYFPPEIWDEANTYWLMLDDSQQAQVRVAVLAEFEQLRDQYSGIAFLFSFGMMDFLWFGLAGVTAFKLGATREEEHEGQQHVHVDGSTRMENPSFAPAPEEGMATGFSSRGAEPPIAESEDGLPPLRRAS